MDLLFGVAGRNVPGELVLAALLVDAQEDGVHSGLLVGDRFIGHSGANSSEATSRRVTVLAVLIGVAIAYQLGVESTVHSVQKTAYIQGYVDCFMGKSNGVEEDSDLEVRSLRGGFPTQRVSMEMATQYGAQESVLHQPACERGTEVCE